MDRSTIQREKRLAELKKEVNRRGFDRHASVLKDILGLPAELQSPALAEISTCEAIHTIIMFPQQIQRGWDYVPKQALLFTSGGVVHILASIWPGEEPQVRYVRACDLMSLKVTLVLLYGYLEIFARGKESPTRLGMEFNTVAWPCLSTPIRQLLLLSRPSPTAPVAYAGHGDMMQRALDELPIKFSNGAVIHGRLPGQSIEGLVFQPSIWKPWLYFLRRKALANTLLMLTSDFLVVIQEELIVEQGWVVSYIPRACITEIRNRPCDRWHELTLCLQRDHQTAQHTFRLGGEAARAWCGQWSQHGGRWRELSAESVQG